MSEQDDPIEDPQEEPQEPIGGGGGLPFPSQRQQFGKLPGLSRRQTYAFIIAIPTIQLAVCFIVFFITWSGLYEIAYSFLIQITGFSLLTGLHQWYMAKFSGSCSGALLSVYTLILVNIINIIHLTTPINYYLVYGLIITGLGLLLSIAFFRAAIIKRRNQG